MVAPDGPSSCPWAQLRAADPRHSQRAWLCRRPAGAPSLASTTGRGAAPGAAVLLGPAEISFLLKVEEKTFQGKYNVLMYMLWVELYPPPKFICERPQPPHLRIGLGMDMGSLESH